MTAYNRGDFYPRTGDEINTSGNVVNEADGINTDGSENVVVKGNAYTLIQQGTINVASGAQYPTTSNINVPSQNYRRFALAFHNASGQTIVSGTFTAQNATFGSFTGNVVEINGKSIPSATNGFASIVNLFPETIDPPLFIFNVPITIQFNLSAVTSATGSIDWALYGY